MKTCVILGGGKGTRMAPITSVISKIMLPINNKPVVHYLLEEAQKSGYEFIIIIANKNDYNLKKYLHVYKDLFPNIKIVYENNAKGPAQALMLTKKYIKQEYFGLMFGDDFYDSKTYPIEQLGSDAVKIGMKKVFKEEVPLYGMIIHENNVVNKIVEKPSIDNVSSLDVVVGRFILPKKIFKIISNLKNIENDQQFIESLNILCSNENVYCQLIEGDNFDIGNKKGYIKANINAYNNSVIR